MNNFEKNKVKKYIVKGDFIGFIKKNKFDYQSFLYYCKHVEKYSDFSEILDYIIKSDDLGLILDAIIYVPFEIPKEYVKTIVDIFYEKGNKTDIRRLSSYLKNISLKDADLLLKKLISLKAYDEVYSFLFNVNNIDKLSAINFLATASTDKYLLNILERIKLDSCEVNKIVGLLEQNFNTDFIKIFDLKQAERAHAKIMTIILTKYNSNELMRLVNTKFVPTSLDLVKILTIFLRQNNLELYIDFLCNYKTDKINSDKITSTIYNELDMHPNAKLIYNFITKCNYYISENDMSLFKSLLIKTFDIKYIALYIIFTKDYELMHQIFGDTLYFYLYCKKEGLIKDINEIQELFDKVEFDLDAENNKNYIDSNISDYVRKIK